MLLLVSSWIIFWTRLLGRISANILCSSSSEWNISSSCRSPSLLSLSFSSNLSILSIFLWSGFLVVKGSTSCVFPCNKLSPIFLDLSKSPFALGVSWSTSCVFPDNKLSSIFWDLSKSPLALVVNWSTFCVFPDNKLSSISVDVSKSPLALFWTTGSIFCTFMAEIRLSSLLFRPSIVWSLAVLLSSRGWCVVISFSMHDSIESEIHSIWTFSAVSNSEFPKSVSSFESSWISFVAEESLFFILGFVSRSPFSSACKRSVMESGTFWMFSIWFKLLSDITEISDTLGWHVLMSVLLLSISCGFWILFCTPSFALDLLLLFPVLSTSSSDDRLE